MAKGNKSKGKTKAGARRRLARRKVNKNSLAMNLGMALAGGLAGYFGSGLGIEMLRGQKTPQEAGFGQYLAPVAVGGLGIALSASKAPVFGACMAAGAGVAGAQVGVSVADARRGSAGGALTAAARILRAPTLAGDEIYIDVPDSNSMSVAQLPFNGNVNDPLAGPGYNDRMYTPMLSGNVNDPLGG